MPKKPKILGYTSHTLKMECPNCKESVFVAYNKNRWTELFRGTCWACGWSFQLRDTEFDIVQPDTPFFEMIYKVHPERETEKKEKIARLETEQKKADLEKKYWEERYDPLQKHTRFKAAERRTIEKEVLKED